MAFRVYDPEKQQYASSVFFFTRESAEQHITEWQDRQERGGCSDLSREFLLRIRVVEVE